MATYPIQQGQVQNTNFGALYIMGDLTGAGSALSTNSAPSGSAQPNPNLCFVVPPSYNQSAQVWLVSDQACTVTLWVLEQTYNVWFAIKSAIAVSSAPTPVTVPRYAHTYIQLTANGSSAHYVMAYLA
jgi:hypothetical protein